MKKLLAFIACLFSFATQAATVTINWSEATNPAAGWNLYFNHLQTPDALQYIGSIAASERSAVLHNISTTGLYQFAVSRVVYTYASGANRRTENAITIVTVLDGVVVNTVGDVVVTSVNIVE